MAKTHLDTIEITVATMIPTARNYSKAMAMPIP